MSYTSWSVVFGEQPSATKWNLLGSNDASLRDGSGLSITTNNCIPALALTTSAIKLGFTSITSTVDNTSASDTEIATLATAVTVPAGGRDVEIAVECSIGTSASSVNYLVKIWDGAVGGTLVRGFYTQTGIASAGQIMHQTYTARQSAPTSGAHTYRVSVQSNGSATFRVYADSTSPASMTVKAI